MQNCVFVFPNRADQATFSGGNWLETLPISLLGDRDIALRARSVDTHPANTQYVCTLDAARPIDWFAALNGNWSLDGRYRITASDDITWSYLLYDSGWHDILPVQYDTDALEWEDDNWWDGRPTEADLAANRHDLIHPLPEPVIAPHWRLQLDDPGNPDGHIEIGRQVLGLGWQPRFNFSWGSGLGVLSTTESKRLKHSGRKVYSPSPSARTYQFALNNLEAADAYSRAYELIRQADVHGEMLFVPDPTDAVNLYRRTMYATLAKLDVLRHPNFAQFQLAFDLEEII